jgi:hypothetical protein
VVSSAAAVRYGEVASSSGGEGNAEESGRTPESRRETAARARAESAWARER